jgi:hypothetical protein
MHIAATQKVQEVKVKLGELHIKMRNCKTPKQAEGQSVDYDAIYTVKRGLLPYPPDAYTPPIRDRGPPCGEAVTIAKECPYICRDKNFYYQKLCHSYIARATKLMRPLPP